jgi:hypothetical protein
MVQRFWVPGYDAELEAVYVLYQKMPFSFYPTFEP